MKCKDCNNYACPERSDGEMECVFQQWTAKESFDWQSFRAEAAKDILCSVLPSIPIIDGDFDKSISNAITNSINTADELIKQLKKRRND